ncbi:sulfite reductase subunit alpha [Pseudomaricurvus sp.]|uniref:sulfite reductase subunit alpha n=1 Tax=Pseudomaricurvus sp. TaxID=2004510 RepID=UPI003F6BBFE6
MSELEKLLLTVCILAVYGVFCWFCYRSYERSRREVNGSWLKAIDPSEEVCASAILVAYASQSGTALHYASQISKSLEGPVQLLSLDRVDDDILASITRAIFVVSTYGEGEPPDNGARFSRRYLAASAKDLSHLHFAVLALGDRSYQYFCRFGRSVYQGLKHHGATPLFQMVEQDAQSEQASSLNLVRWYEQLRDSGIPINRQSHEVPDSPDRAGDYYRWNLTARTQVNSGSPGEPLYYLQLQPQAGEQQFWAAGDIAEIIPRYPSEQSSASVDQSPLVSREYSIASIPEDGSLDLLVRQQCNPDGSFGLASGWLTHHLEAGGEVELRIRNNPFFRAPEEDVPLILIGNGSGYAGLRSMLRERYRVGQHKNWLLFGERSPTNDRIFKEELAEWQRTGHLQKVDLTFSRCPNNPQYVQDALLAADELPAWIEKGAVVMICGSLKGMAEGVDRALREIFGDEQLEALHAAGRYRRDVY